MTTDIGVWMCRVAFERKGCRLVANRLEPSEADILMFQRSSRACVGNLAACLSFVRAESSSEFITPADTSDLPKRTLFVPHKYVL